MVSAGRTTARRASSAPVQDGSCQISALSATLLLPLEPAYGVSSLIICIFSLFNKYFPPPDSMVAKLLTSLGKSDWRRTPEPPSPKIPLNKSLRDCLVVYISAMGMHEPLLLVKSSHQACGQLSFHYYVCGSREVTRQILVLTKSNMTSLLSNQWLFQATKPGSA